MATIGQAAVWIEEGKAVRRKEWKGDCVLVKTENGVVVARSGRPPAFDSRWLTAETDVLADDWMEVEQ